MGSGKKEGGQPKAGKGDSWGGLVRTRWDEAPEDRDINTDPEALGQEEALSDYRATAKANTSPGDFVTTTSRRGVNSSPDPEGGGFPVF